MLNQFWYILRKFSSIENLIHNNYKFFVKEEGVYKYIITSNNNEQYKNNKDINNISDIIICEDKIKEKYHMPKNSSLYLLIIIKSLKEISILKKEFKIHYFFKGKKIKDICEFEFKEKILNTNCNFILTTTNECKEFCSIHEVLNKTCIIKNDNNNIIEKNITNGGEFLDDIIINMFEEIYYNISSLEKGNDTIIENEKMVITLTKTDDQKNMTKNINEAIITLGLCEYELRKHYNYSGTLYIKKDDIIQPGLKIPKIEYEVYARFNNKTLKKLNLSICEGLIIDLKIPFNISDLELLKYDINSLYYQSICFIVIDENGYDIPLKDRRNEFLEKQSIICPDEDCHLNVKNNEPFCSCLTRTEKIKKKMNEFIEIFKGYQNIANIYVLRCIHLLLNKNNLIKNLGFLIICPLFIFYIISIVIFFCKDFKSIKKIIDNIINVKKMIKNEKNKKKDNKKKKTNKIIVVKKMDNIQQNNKNKLKKKSKSSCIKIKKNPPIKKAKNKKIKKSILSNNNFHLTKKNTRKNKSLSSRITTNNSRKEIKSVNLSLNLEESYSILDYSSTELNDLPYEKAKELDERTYCVYYLNLLKSNNMFLFAFFKSDDYNSRIMKINLFFYMFIIHFGVNALFFDENEISRMRKNNTDNKTVKKTDRQIYISLSLSIYSFIISIILKKLLKFLSLSENNILKLKRKEENDLDKETKSIKRIILIKFIFFFILSLVILIFFFFYLSCFCVVYKKTQFSIITNCLSSFGDDFIFPFFLDLIPGLLRICALKGKNKKYLYCLSKLIQMLI